MKLYVRLEAPFEWVRVAGRVVQAFGEVPSAADYPLSEEDEIIGVVPGEWVTVHRVSLPARSKRQFMAALPYALEESLSEEVESLHFVCQEWHAGQESVVLVVARERMLKWQSIANQSKLPLDRLVPDYALLPMHDAAHSTLAAVGQGEQILARHKNGSGAHLDADFIDIWLADIPLGETVAVNEEALTKTLIERFPERDFRFWEFGNKMAHWLEHKSNSSLDLMGERYRPSVRTFDLSALKVPGMMAAAALLLVLVFDVYRYFALHGEVRSVLDEQAQILQQAFPEITDVPDGMARQLMERALSNRVGKPENHTATSMLAVTANVVRQQRIELAEVGFRDDKLTITCVLNDLSQVDQITRGLNSQPRITAQLESSANDDGKILASFVLEARS